MKKSISKEEVLNSSAFKVLNYMIDNKVKEIQSWMSSIDSTYNYVETYKGYKNEDIPRKYTIRTRTSEEAPPFSLEKFISDDDTEFGEVVVPKSIHNLKRISESIKFIVELEEQIRDLQQQKLYLLQDVDFNDGGDASKAIFGVKEVNG